MNGEIGLHRGTVKLVAHDPKWDECFRQEKERLASILGEKALDIRHIGSTSIAGIRAKPIIDIIVAVKNLSDVQTFTRKDAPPEFLRNEQRVLEKPLSVLRISQTAPRRWQAILGVETESRRQISK